MLHDHDAGGLAQPLLAAVLARAGLTGSAATSEAALTVRRSGTCVEPHADPDAHAETPTPPPAPANPDTSSDGLPNTQEATLGTNPDDPDTDDDGLGDGLEVAGIVVREQFEVCGGKAKRSITVSPNPLLADTDKDGIGDGTEVNGYVIKQRVVISNKGATYVIGKTRTDPTRKDTDRDGLSDRQEQTGSANKRWDRHKTDPSKCDTDHGALSDGIEVKHRSDPADFRSGPGDPGTIPMGGVLPCSGFRWCDLRPGPPSAIMCAMNGEARVVRVRAPYALARALAATAVVLLGALSAHTWAGGTVPSGPGLALVAAVVLAGGLLLFTREVPPRALLPVVAAAQLGLHASFGLVAEHAHHAASLRTPAPAGPGRWWGLTSSSPCSPPSCGGPADERRPWSSPSSLRPALPVATRLRPRPVGVRLGSSLVHLLVPPRRGPPPAVLPT